MKGLILWSFAIALTTPSSVALSHSGRGPPSHMSLQWQRLNGGCRPFVIPCSVMRCNFKPWSVTPPHLPICHGMHRQGVPNCALEKNTMRYNTMICDAVSGHSHVHRTEHHVMSCQGMSNPCHALPSSLRPLACTSVLFMMSCSLSLTSRGINVLTLLRVFTFSLSKVQKTRPRSYCVELCK